MDDVVRDDARTLRPARRAGRRPHPRGRRGPGAGVHQAALRRRQPAAAGRQHRRHRPLVPDPGHAGTLEAFLHYRIVDVSSIKELSRRWFPRAYFNAPAKRGNHRALADIQESIEELRYYREAVFVAPPGPDSDAAKELAAKHGGALTGLTGDRVATHDSEDAAGSV